MSGLDRDSTFDEIDRLMDNDEFGRLMQQSSGESEVSASQASSLPITPGLLDTAFLNESCATNSSQVTSSQLSGPIIDQVTSNVPYPIENTAAQESETIDLCTPPSIAVQPEIEIIDLTSQSTIDLSTPKTIILDESTSDDEPRNDTDDSPVRLSPT